MTHPAPELRRRLLMRAAIDPDCTARERDNIIRHLFPGLDPDQTIARLRDVWQAWQAKEQLAANRIVDELIEQDRAAPKPIPGKRRS